MSRCPSWERLGRGRGRAVVPLCSWRWLGGWLGHSGLPVVARRVWGGVELCRSPLLPLLILLFLTALLGRAGLLLALPRQELLLCCAGFLLALLCHGGLLLALLCGVGPLLLLQCRPCRAGLLPVLPWPGRGVGGGG